MGEGGAWEGENLIWLVDRLLEREDWEGELGMGQVERVERERAELFRASRHAARREAVY